MKAHPSNFCGGNYQDWLEVMLIPECNGRCAWCVEKDGYHPKCRASWRELAAAILGTGKQKIVLLGGEPTLYTKLKELVRRLIYAERDVYVTTNGSVLHQESILDALNGVTGVNISIHDYDLEKNQQVVGLRLDHISLISAIRQLHRQGASVRLNCTAVKGHIDSMEHLLGYVSFGKVLGADSVRFSEVKGDAGCFVDLVEVAQPLIDTCDDPFTDGCCVETEVLDLPVSFRLMCGLQTPCRQAPENPEQFHKQVMYYDGQLYDGWQKEEKVMTKKDLKQLLIDVREGRMSLIEAEQILEQLREADNQEARRSVDQGSGGGCQY